MRQPHRECYCELVKFSTGSVKHINRSPAHYSADTRGDTRGVGWSESMLYHNTRFSHVPNVAPAVIAAPMTRRVYSYAFGTVSRLRWHQCHCSFIICVKKINQAIVNLVTSKQPINIKLGKDRLYSSLNFLTFRYTP